MARRRRAREEVTVVRVDVVVAVDPRLARVVPQTRLVRNCRCVDAVGACHGVKPTTRRLAAAAGAATPAPSPACPLAFVGSNREADDNCGVGKLSLTDRHRQYGVPALRRQEPLRPRVP